MLNVFLVIAAVLPVAVLCYYIYAKDYNKEPIGLLMKIFGLGCVSVIPVLFFEVVLDVYFPTEGVDSLVLNFINVFISVALVEEAFKWIIVKFIGYNNREFDELYDIIVYSVFSSLGFACIENICYVLQNGFDTAILRALLSVPGHTCFAVVMGYFFAQARLCKASGNMSKYTQNVLLSLFAPTLVHTMYDALLVDSDLFYAFLLFDAVMVSYCFTLVNKMSKIQNNVTIGVKNGSIQSDASGHMHFSSRNTSPINFCPICGKVVNSNSFCGNCGFKLK